MVISATFLPPDATEEDVATAKETWKPVAERGTGAYGNFISTDGPDDVARMYPPETLRRLVEVKRAFDPENVFRRNHNIDPG